MYLESHTVGELDFKPLAPGGVFLVGQEQDIVDGAFNENQAFCGRVTDVEMWKIVRSAASISRMSDCLDEDITLHQVIWKVMEGNNCNWTNMVMH